MADQISHDYDTTMLDMLQIIWGEGYLSPGGPQAVREIVAGIDLAGKRVLDIGCGIGGLDEMLVELGASHVTAVDVAAPLIALARRRVADPRIAFEVIEPEQALPFANASFDVVFTKDAWLHVIDKRALLGEVHRVLKPGGRLAGGDWMKGPEPFSAGMVTRSPMVMDRLPVRSLSRRYETAATGATAPSRAIGGEVLHQRAGRDPGRRGRA